MPSLLAGECWRHWPKMCNCPPTVDEVEQMKSETFLLDAELQRTRRQVRKFSEALKSLAESVIKASNLRVEEGGLDNLPPDMHYLSEEARSAIDLLLEPRNQSGFRATVQEDQ